MSKDIAIREDVVSTIKHLLVSDLFVDVPEDEIGLDDGFQSVLGLDSLSFIELRVLCERQFGVHIADADFSPDNFRSLRRLSTLIERLQAEKE